MRGRLQGTALGTLLLGLLVVSVGATLLLGGSAQAAGQAHQAIAAQSFVIRVSASSIRVGGYQIRGSSRLPTYAGAIAAFGTPQSCTLRRFGSSGPPADNYGRATWRTLGLQMDFISYGMIPSGGDACNQPSGVQLDTLWITGSQWHTALGLRVGATVSTLQRLYPRALPHGSVFWLLTGRNVVGTVSLYPIFSATITNGHVSSLIFGIHAEGD